MKNLRSILFFGLFAFLNPSVLFAVDIDFGESSVQVTEGTSGTYSYANIDIDITGACSGTFKVEIDEGTAHNSNGSTYKVDYDYMYAGPNGANSGSNSDASWSGVRDNDKMTITISASDATTIQMSVRIYADERFEGGSGAADETFELELEESEPSDNQFLGQTVYVASNQATCEVQIDDDEASVPAIGFTLTSQTALDEDGGNRYIYIDETGAVLVGETVTFDWAITNVTTVDADHYTAMTGSITWTENYTDKYFYYNASDDVWDEPLESFLVTISNNNSNCTINTAYDVTTGYIVDVNDPPYVYFNSSSSTGQEATADDGTPDITIPVKLQRASGFDNVSVSYTVTYPGSDAADGNNGADDHDLSSGTITFGNAGVTSTNITFDIEDDAYDEADSESLIIT